VRLLNGGSGSGRAARQVRRFYAGSVARISDGGAGWPHCEQAHRRTAWTRKTVLWRPLRGGVRRAGTEALRSCLRVMPFAGGFPGCAACSLMINVGRPRVGSTWWSAARLRRDVGPFQQTRRGVSSLSAAARSRVRQEAQIIDGKYITCKAAIGRAARPAIRKE